MLRHPFRLMLSAIDFQYEFQFRTVEIDDIPADWHLPAKLESAERSITKPIP